MTIRLLGESCAGGPCPTLYVSEDGDVTVQGYTTTIDRQLPDGEEVVRIDAAAWARLLADLPIAMLLRALVAPWRFRRARATGRVPAAAPARP